ncbi:hypothetical protein C8T65DRAFT_587795 [Cerioporus squamosus]|nr:hypothetical protein C8T65DRAFT_587795 [Cerioporus squamosus]
MELFDDSKLPTPEEVATFNGKTGHCCTIEDFRPDLAGTPRSMWNKSAAAVFAKAFVTLPDAPCRTRKTVEEAFGTHLIGLCKAYRNWKQAGSPQRLERMAAARRAMRKDYVHERRVRTVADHPLLSKHLWIIQALKPAGMSSDEEEHVGPDIVYRRVRQDWRNPLMVEWFRVVDYFTKTKYIGPNGGNTPGARPHRRQQIAKSTSERDPVRYLPRSAYNPEWLAKQSEFMLDWLSPSDKPYSFIHEAAVLKYVSELCACAGRLTRLHREAAALQARFQKGAA